MKLPFLSEYTGFTGVFIYSQNRNNEKIFLELSTNRIIFHEFIEKRKEFGHTGGSLGEK
jgi:hypothetical protein